MSKLQDLAQPFNKLHAECCDRLIDLIARISALALSPESISSSEQHL